MDLFYRPGSRIKSKYKSMTIKLPGTVWFLLTKKPATIAGFEIFLRTGRLSNLSANVFLNQSFINFFKSVLHELLTEIYSPKVTANLAQK